MDILTYINKKYVFIALFVITVFVFLIFIFNYSLLSVKSPDGANVILISSKDNGEQKISSSWKLVKTGEYTVVMSTETQVTKKDIAVKALRPLSAELAFKNQRHLDKVATNALPCVMGPNNRIVTGEVFSYDCYNSSTVQRNSYTEKISELPITNLPVTEFTRPYGDGLLMLGGYSPDSTSLSFFNTITQQVSLFKTWVGNSGIADYRLSVDGQKIYILDIKQKKLLTFNNRESPPTEQSYDFEIGDAITVEVLGDRVFILSSFGGLDNTDEFGGGTLFVFNRTNTELVKEVSVSEKYQDIAFFKPINEDSIAFAGDVKNTVEIHNINNFDSYKILRDSTRYTVSEGRVYTLSNDGDVYEYNIEEQVYNLIFKSKRVYISEITTSNGQIYLNGYSRSLTENSTGMSFLLTNNDSKDGARLEDIFPVDVDTSGSTVSYVDYLGNAVTVSLLLSSKVTDKQTGIISFDKNEFESKKNKALEEFKAMGLNIADYQFIFTDI